MKARIPGSERTELSASDPGREPILAVEYVRTVLFDVGRSIDLRLAAAALPGSSDFKPVKRRNTPASLTLPRTLSVPLAPGLRGKDPQTSMEGAEASAKLYEEGVISLTVRARLAARLSELHSLGSRLFPLGNNSPATVDGYIEDRFRDLQESLGLAITPEVPGAPPEREHYTAYCISDWGSGSPDDFVARNRKVLASLLEGEPAARDLHETQIAKSLGNSFSYGAEDLAVFDLEHCVIMDRSGDWEDLLLIAEHANYQLLELRVLDRLLDQWLDEAEKDLRDMYAGGRHSRRVRNRGLPARFARLQNLRLEALFILENLENSAKIIGDYFLGQIYVHLGLVFSVEGWTRSVERHLGALQSIYEIVKSDKSERTMVFLEIVFIVVCIAFPVHQILQVMLSG
ncbi:MAG TPA: hypothetical protein VLH39_02855 [Magnetospirillaceae bacterium]|nr:hypothetical protein [Magnetospirillaceae bacterium]